jgi:hypothetical protein
MKALGLQRGIPYEVSRDCRFYNVIYGGLFADVQIIVDRCKTAFVNN